MKIKRYTDKDSHGAMLQARTELGDDAVILHNKRTGDTVEIVAAVDLEDLDFSAPDEGEILQNHLIDRPMPGDSAATSDSEAIVRLQREIGELRSAVEHGIADLAWHQSGSSPSLRSELLDRLAGLGLSRSLCLSVANEVVATYSPQSWWSAAERSLTSRLPIYKNATTSQTNVVALVGATGVGKTTTVAKMAAKASLQYGADRVALISMDCNRIGAQEQLQTFAKYLNIGLSVANDEQGLSALLNQYQDRKLVIIDTAGMSHRDCRLRAQLQMLRSTGHLIELFLVMQATSSREGLRELVAAFDPQHITAAIVTKTDEAVELGSVIDTVVACKMPLAYVSDGQKIPENLQTACAEALINAAINLGKRPAITSACMFETAGSTHSVERTIAHEQ